MKVPGALKTTLLQMCRFGGINRMARNGKRRKLLVLAYHGVVAKQQTDRLRYATTVSLAEFDQHMAALRESFHPVSAADVAAWYEGKSELPDHPVLVTFDDGYRNNLTLAAPVLRTYGIPCVFFVATGYIGTPRMLWTSEMVNILLHWPEEQVPAPDGVMVPVPRDAAGRRQLADRIKESCKRIPWDGLRAYLERLRSGPAKLDENEELYGFLNWDEVRELRRQGFEIGAHTVEHPILSQVAPEQLRFELRESKRRIEEETGAPCTAVAYPNGDRKSISKAVAEAARGEGYRLGFTTVEMFTAKPAHALLVNRLCIMGHLPVDSFRFRVSGLRTPSDHGAGPFAGG